MKSVHFLFLIYHFFLVIHNNKIINRDFQINLVKLFLKVLSGYRLRHLAEKPPLLRAKGKTKKYVNLVGLEPTPHSLKGYYSNQLSYRFVLQ